MYVPLLFHCLQIGAFFGKPFDMWTFAFSVILCYIFIIQACPDLLPLHPAQVKHCQGKS